MSYYKDQNNAYKALETKILEIIDLGGVVDVEKLVYDLTLEYPVGEKSLLKRIDTFISFRKTLELKNGLIQKRKKENVV